MSTKLQMLISRLEAGEKVENKEGGNSMLPLIKSKQPVTIEAVDTSKLEKGDIVYVKVHGRVYTHLITALKAGEVQIGNNHGGINGWTKLDNVYGIITEIEGVPVRGAKEKVQLPKAVPKGIDLRRVPAFKVGERVRLTDSAWAASFDYRGTLSRAGEIIEVKKHPLGEINVRHDKGAEDLEDGRREWRWPVYLLELENER